MVVKLTTSFPLTISQCQKEDLLVNWLVGTMLKLQEPVFCTWNSGAGRPTAGLTHFAFRFECSPTPCARVQRSSFLSRSTC